MHVYRKFEVVNMLLQKNHELVCGDFYVLINLIMLQFIKIVHK